MVRLAFTTDPAEFLAGAGDWLATDPVVNTVVTTMAEREAKECAEGARAPVDRPYWWLTVHDDADVVVGAAMRTADFSPYPLFVLALPESATVALARELHSRGEDVGGVNGTRPAADEVAEEYARLCGRKVEVVEHTRLFELEDLVPPGPVSGRIRVVRRDEAELAVAWYDAFTDEVGEQADRVTAEEPRSRHSLQSMLRRVEQDRVCFWVDDDDRPLQVTGFNAPAYGVARIGPVYTPREHRGRGYASAAVAAVSQRLRQEDVRVCLYTDQANPAANRMYLDLGFRRVLDQTSLLLEPASSRSAQRPITRPAPV